MTIQQYHLQDTVAVTGNMVYDFTEDNSEVPDLESFKMRLVCQMLRSAYFQNETKENIIITKLPNIIAPRLVKKQINSDIEKKSLFNKPVNYGSNTMAGLAQLILKQKIDILNLDNLDASEVKNISKALHLKGTSSKSVIRLLEEIKFVCKMYAAGQGMFLFLLVEAKTHRVLGMPLFLPKFVVVLSTTITMGLTLDHRLVWLCFY